MISEISTNSRSMIHFTNFPSREAAGLKDPGSLLSVTAEASAVSRLRLGSKVGIACKVAVVTPPMNIGTVPV